MHSTLVFGYVFIYTSYHFALMVLKRTLHDILNVFLLLIFCLHCVDCIQLHEIVCVDCIQ